ncbi:MAG: DNA polymerase III subunit delta [Firmicutes bacterium]|nr:DNA polymerase III subunit delta [Bacillota bacterium]
MNIYLIVSESIRLIDEEIKKITKNLINIEKFDLNIISLEELLNEASYLSLFNEKRVIIAKNSYMFGNDKENKTNNELLLKYIENPNENTVLIFTYNGKADMRKKITKEIKEKYKLINIEKLKFSDLQDKIRTIVKNDGYTIDLDSINYLINNCLNNYDLIYNELEKLKLYYNAPCKFEFEDVKKIVSKSIDENNFKFVEYIINRDLKKAFKMLDDFNILKVEPISLINLLAREYRLMYFTKQLYEENKSLNTISKELKLQDWQTEKILKNSFNYNYNELENNLLVLNECDLQIKSVYFDKYSLLKIFMLKLL